MMQIPNKINGATALAPEEYNSPKNELQNVVLTANIQFDPSDDHQLSKAIQKIRKPNVYFTDTGILSRLELINANLSFKGTLPPEGLIVRFKSKNMVTENYALPPITTICDSLPIKIVTPFVNTPNSPYIRSTYNKIPYSFEKFPYWVWWEGRVFKNTLDNNELTLRVDPISSIWNYETIFKIQQGLDSDTALLDIPYVLGLNGGGFPYNPYTGTILRLLEVTGDNRISFNKLVEKIHLSDSDTTGNVGNGPWTVYGNQHITANPGQLLLLSFYALSNGNTTSWFIKLMGII